MFLTVTSLTTATATTAFRWTRLSRQPYFHDRVAAPTPLVTLGDSECCYGFQKDGLEPDSDILAFTEGLVSVTPVSIDLTSRVSLQAL